MASLVFDELRVLRKGACDSMFICTIGYFIVT